jgi:hypothetical protein
MRASTKPKPTPTPPESTPKPVIGIEHSTRAFIGATEDLDEQEARRAFMLAAMDLASMLNGLAGHANADVISHVLLESARRYGIPEREAERLVGEVVAFLGESSSWRPGTLPPALAALTVDKAHRLDAFLRGSWGDDAP